jgi:hypothetical protein
LSGSDIEYKLSEIVAHLLKLRDFWSALPKTKLFKLLGRLTSLLVDTFMETVSGDPAVTQQQLVDLMDAFVRL